MASSCKSLLSSSSRLLIPFPSISPRSINSDSDSISFSSNFSGGAKLLKKPQSIFPCPNLSPESYICKAKRQEAPKWYRKTEDGSFFVDFLEPNHEFADAETEKFRRLLKADLSKRKDLFGDNFNEMVDACAEILSDYLHTEFEGPGTGKLPIDPFACMGEALELKGLPRKRALKLVRGIMRWTKRNLGKDWKKWIETHGE